MAKLDLLSILDFPKDTSDEKQLSESLRVLGIIEKRVRKDTEAREINEALSLLRQRFARILRDTSLSLDGVSERLSTVQSKLSNARS